MRKARLTAWWFYHLLGDVPRRYEAFFCSLARIELSHAVNQRAEQFFSFAPPSALGSTDPKWRSLSTSNKTMPPGLGAIVNRVAVSERSVRPWTNLCRILPFSRYKNAWLIQCLLEPLALRDSRQSEGWVRLLTDFDPTLSLCSLLPFSP